MSDNFFVQHPEVMRYILKHEQLSRDTDAWIAAVSHENAAQAVEDERCVPVIPCEDEPIHTPDHPFCWDDSCPCKDAHGELWTEYLDKPFKDGLLTVREANRILYDKQV